ncbi:MULTISPECIES: GntR family transcriptional regulator [Corynebacterium]|uniref:GntR family transcriptional regulator n=3 Tax=Corynebacterium TaxID=1716 RepID=A0ACC4U9G9_9CORY|nr:MULTISPECIES: GntR family transcriptional regulator [Corynebacterium]KKO78140.1 GntR family transcriptional regulator [Corynebacterium minutissimum]MTD91587.1 GntR family transcriptional regulator [Corynebacterium aurimucosum]OFK65395.1 GntR family transcriptional regulator [Corynebacterium sp. HMSC074A09]OFN77035.1 GntR family transcriptional regulator [Corynebacterium sp. HMSC070E08]OFP26742.1 GntR family transcriptional regulator [Corynebacterium sp. HMSC068G04]
MTQTAAPAGESKSQQAYNWISERIRTRDYEPGYRLVLATIADELGISVVPVREAIRQLEAEGMVTYERNVGASVTTYNREAYYESMDIVATVEANATAQSAPYLNAEDIARAREINQRMRELDIHHDPEEFTQLNKEFHSVLFSKCPNERLKDLVVDQWKQLEYHRVSTFRYVPERAQESTREHEQLVSLIEAGAEPAYIEKVARQHRLATLNTYRKKND